MKSDSTKIMSNPVLYILLGRAIPMFESFTDILEEYGLDGAAFIKIYEQPHYEWIKDEINRIQQEFIRRSYDSNGVIRINYVISSDNWDIHSLRETVEKYVSMLYPLEVYADIYWFLDDASALDGRTPSRIKTMKTLTSKKLTKAQVYLFSNLDNNNVFTQEEDQFRTLALLSVFKDYKPSHYPVSPEASRYNEFMFLENAINHGQSKGFLSAGCRSLQIPQKELKGFLVNILLDLGSNQSWPEPSDFNIMHFIRGEYVLFSKIVDREYIYGLAIPEIRSADFKGISRKVIISRLFGKRLDNILDIYIGDSIRLPDMESLNHALEDLHFYQALYLLGDEGKWRRSVRKVSEETRQALQTATSELESWLDSEHNVKDKARRRLSPWVRPENWPYQLAEGYIERLFRINALKALNKHLQQTMSAIDAYYNVLLGYQETVKKAQSTLNWDTTALNAAFDHFVPRISDYFFMLFKDYESSRVKALKAVTDPMLGHLKEGTFAQYISYLAEFVDDKLLPALNLNFAGLLRYLENECKGHLPALLSEWAVRGRRFGVQLRTGYVSLYSEANLFMPTGAEISKIKSRYESHGLGRINLFVDEHAGRIDVLYQAGIFGVDDLYYKDLYI